jgi:hypothetical protein
MELSPCSLLCSLVLVLICAILVYFSAVLAYVIFCLWTGNMVLETVNTANTVNTVNADAKESGKLNIKAKESQDDIICSDNCSKIKDE